MRALDDSPDLGRPGGSHVMVGHTGVVPRPLPTSVYHMTRMEHVASIARVGLLADAGAGAVVNVEIGNQGIKQARRTRVVEAGPGGVVADYAPFYFTPRTPMQYAISKGNVPTYTDGTPGLVFLRSTTQRLRELELDVVISDRNARQEVAQFTDGDDLESFVDWDIIAAQFWNEHIEGRERRQAECLVHGKVPWKAVLEVGVHDQTIADAVVRGLEALSLDSSIVHVRPGWYF